MKTKVLPLTKVEKVILCKDRVFAFLTNRAARLVQKMNEAKNYKTLYSQYSSKAMKNSRIELPFLFGRFNRV